MTSTPGVEHITGPLVGKRTFLLVIWTLCGISISLLASRIAIRMSTKGRLMTSDYYLFMALPALFTGTGLLQFNIDILYSEWLAPQPSNSPPVLPNAPSQLKALMEMLWLSIFCVKFCFISQFKFHKPPYAYVSVALTRYYWVCVCICGAAFLFALSQPIAVCPTAERCQYYRTSSWAIALEVALTVIDIITDFLVMLIPVSLIFMANFSRLHSLINGVFKGLSIFSIIVAATRLAFILSRHSPRIDYVGLVFLLQVEGAVAISMASISSYRVIILNHLNGKQQQEALRTSAFPKAHACWTRVRTQNESDHAGHKVQHPDQELHLALWNVSIPEGVRNASTGSRPDGIVTQAGMKHSMEP